MYIFILYMCNIYVYIAVFLLTALLMPNVGFPHQAILQFSKDTN